MTSVEEALVDAFIVRAKRERYKAFLANPKRRRSIVEKLDHCGDIDLRYATEIPSNVDVAAFLRGRGAPPSCHLISAASTLDGKQMDLKDAIAEVEARMSGTLVGCIPGRLAYYYDEAGTRRLLLQKAASP